MARVHPARLSVSEREGTALKAALLELKREVPSDADLEALRGQILQRLGFEHSDSGVRVLPAALRTGALDVDRLVPCRGDERRSLVAPSGGGRRARAPGRRLRAHQCTVLVGALLAAAAVALLISTHNGGSSEAPSTARDSRGEEPPTGVHSVLPSPPESEPPVVALASSAGSEGAPLSKRAAGAPGDRRRNVTIRRRAVSVPGERSASNQKSRVEASSAPGQPAQRAATAHLAGVININSIPFTRVVLDGRVLGGTPLVGVTVSPGEHTVLFVDFDGERRLKKVNVDPGRTVLAAVRFD